LAVDGAGFARDSAAQLAKALEQLGGEPPPKTS